MGQMVDKVREVSDGAADVVPVNRSDGDYLMPQQIVERIKALHG